VVDLATRAVAARPLKTKNGAEVLQQLQDIYTTDPRLKVPQRMEVDAGTEFNAAAKWLRPGRHTQQRAVENLNRALGTAIARRQTSEELLTDSVARHWVSDLQPFVAAVNEKWLRVPPPAASGFDPPADKGPLLDVGDRVRVALDRPQSVLGHTLPAGTGKSGFRAGDIRWDPVVREVTDIRFKPGQTTRYSVTGIRNATYGPWQLQRVGTETFPAGKDVIRGKPAGYVPLALHGRKNVGGRVHFHVEWRGFPAEADWTWEPRTSLIKSTKGARLVRAYPP